MSCGCKGSTPQAQKKVLTRDQAAAQQAAPPRQRRQGLPGEPGYAWNGPRRR